ncbi:ankyrin repeat protein [Sporormia fimetaria CBS 119925]|uniref:Ankyrin repeat protein n=1 Tax=Sporormia fimetaria CBS 119925 TaxID=1340428 RepID=A0A6A6UWM0_9PLEO|nr:ankyrin repeat protein [Sporormia fimetaria CBS 119925]
MACTTLPEVPVKHADFLSHIVSNPDQKLSDLLQPYIDYDAELRKVFAQEPNHPDLADTYLNIVPVFNGHEKDVNIRARNLAGETAEEKERYIMPLRDDERRPNGAPAIVQDFHDFKKNFNLFSESALADLDWSNVVAAGSSVTTSLLPVPKEYQKSKRALRNYYHDILAPASDVDLFIYGLSEEQAINKIIEIEKRVKDSILTEITTVRTKNAITIVSQYPTRHIQIVLRVYKSVAEILTGFDVDCSCAAYDGKQVYAAPRALTAFMTQINTIDLTRRSPSYESRLSKYSHRGFEVYWPVLERSRIDPTIFERNFARTVGLARLLVLERLPSKSDRESYMDERRKERGRPAINRGYYRNSHSGNIKDRYEDEVAEWVDQDDVSDYHTFTIPYGPKYYAKKIEKLLYTKDLLLNAEWNKRDDREVNLHRHPAFFGHATDVMLDCCGFCPKPVTPEEEEIAEEESKIYVSGEVSFIKDDPGRQAIGSFHPLTDDDWTEMAYVGNTARLCQAIVDGDLEHVEDWLAQEGADPNCRDYTGRTPLQLAATSSTPEVVAALTNGGARLVARLADGRTALHLAAARGSVDIVRLILQRSEANEEEEAKKEEARKEARKVVKSESKDANPQSAGSEDDMEVVEAESDDDMQSRTTGSYVKVKDQQEKATGDLIPEDESEDEPDVYDVNVLSWDTQCSPLHYAILNGHVNVVKELVQTFGADVLLPIKLLNSHDKSPRGALLTLVLAMRLPLEIAKEMTKTLLEIGASSAQADMNQMTALHVVSGSAPELLDVMFEHDKPAADRALNHLSMKGAPYNTSTESPLMSAIEAGNSLAALKLLELGASAQVEFKDWLKVAASQNSHYTNSPQTTLQADNQKQAFRQAINQPLVLAIMNDLPELALQLLERGADPNELPKHTFEDLYQRYRSYNYNPMESVLDMVREKIKECKEFKDDEPRAKPDYSLKEGVDYLAKMAPGSYKEFIAKIQLDVARERDQGKREQYERDMVAYNQRKGVAEKKKAVEDLAESFAEVEKALLSRNAKTFRELHPDFKIREPDQYRGYHNDYKEPEFSVDFSFRIDALNESDHDGYLEMFQAAWDGDIEKIKSLTLTKWGPSKDFSPLAIAVQDGRHLSPFTIAVLRGHLQTARAIVEIALAQFDPEEEKEERVRYRLGDDDIEDSDEGSQAEEVPVYKHIIDKKFTIDNIAEVSTQVKSRVKPTDMISWKACPYTVKQLSAPNTQFQDPLYHRKTHSWYSEDVSLCHLAIETNNNDLFTFIVELELEWIERLGDAYHHEGSTGLPGWWEADFTNSIKYGRLDMLAEEIRKFGAGLELESLVQKGGVKYKEKPKYYQGLSVHGRKRQDWVNAARGTYDHSITDTTPPLLEAAYAGSLASVEWFLSDTPSRLYNEFAKTHADHKLIKHLNTAAGGFDKVLSKFLNTNREYALHLAVMAAPTKETAELVQYLLKVMPGSLELKSHGQGLTPLALAFTYRRYDAAKILLEAGADQTVRARNGSNLLHVLICDAFNLTNNGDNGLTEFFALIDQRLIPSLLIERCSIDPGSLTPFGLAIRKWGGIEVLRQLLDLGAPSGNEQLLMFDGSGDTPIHYAVKNQQQEMLTLLLEYRPDLLYRENSVGCTPYELAQDAYIAKCADMPHKGFGMGGGSRTSLVKRPYAEFAPDYAEEQRKRVNTKSIWGVCQEAMVKNPGKRKLVSLLDANEVAKRLAKRYLNRRSGAAGGADSDSEDEKEEEVVREDTVRDEVQQFNNRTHVARVREDGTWYV